MSPGEAESDLNLTGPLSSAKKKKKNPCFISYNPEDFVVIPVYKMSVFILIENSMAFLFLTFL